MGNNTAKARAFSEFEFSWPLDRSQVLSLIEQFREGAVIHPTQLHALVDQFCLCCPADDDGRLKVIDVLFEDSAQATVVGDLHGQYWDLLNIFQMNGFPSETNLYVFNGDYVDRGSNGLEVVLTLMAWKTLLPNHVHLMRGNHELEIVNAVYGFQSEIMNKYAEKALYFRMNQVFGLLPVASIINNAIFVVHGGIPRVRDITLDEIRSSKDSTDPLDGSVLSDMLWSDPTDGDGLHPSPRNIGVLFGPDVAARFLELNQLEVVVRAHELCMEGYAIQQGGKVVTVFSAPNYCGRCRNLGAFLVFNSELKMTIRQFAASGPDSVREMCVRDSLHGATQVVSSYF
eukprot:TRINITY_DN4992_c0_g1_i2.p1 TRINITY_DN4992_c0_g1~~TRINITY_DN4992_c0_g1_i2.p1  ORF type:complete len:343 (+),score=82.39 TRINITY_DN4992_c0_g1_i2:246-1274(+)